MHWEKEERGYDISREKNVLRKRKYSYFIKNDTKIKEEIILSKLKI